VVDYFCRGYSTKEIINFAEKEHGIELNREDPWRLISEAARDHRLMYIAPVEHRLTEEACRRYPWLEHRIRIVSTRTSNDLSVHAAQMLLSMIRNRLPLLKVQRRGGLRCGVSGGGLVQRTCKYLAGILSRSLEDTPPRITFHSLVSSLDINPAKDSTNVAAYFGDLSEVNVDFVSLPAPGYVTKKQYGELKTMGSIAEAFRMRSELDIVFSSTGHWVDAGKDKRQHSVLADLLNAKDRDLYLAFLKDGCVGDFIFAPVGRNGLTDFPGENRMMTLLEEASDLATWVANGTEVLGVFGPCAHCGGTKTDVLRSLVDLPKEKRMITHVVTDARTAREWLYR
jgi:hypothetical protein